MEKAKIYFARRKLSGVVNDPNPLDDEIYRATHQKSDYY
jgi:hypothetical protein